MQNGLIYLGMKDIKYLFASLCSALSARRFCSIPISIVTDIEHAALPSISRRYDIRFIKPDKSLNTPEGHKSLVYNYSLYYKTLFIDSDTIVIKDISPVFSFVGRDYQLAAVTGKTETMRTILERINKNGHYGREINEDALATIENCPMSGNWYNGGVLLFIKSNSSELFFKEYHKQYLKYQETDESPFHRALYKTKTKIRDLPFVYNYMNKSMNNPEAVIFHRTRGLLGRFPNFRLVHHYKIHCPDVYDVVLRAFGFNIPTIPKEPKEFKNRLELLNSSKVNKRKTKQQIGPKAPPPQQPEEPTPKLRKFQTKTHGQVTAFGKLPANVQTPQIKINGKKI